MGRGAGFKKPLLAAMLAGLILAAPGCKQVSAPQETTSAAALADDSDGGDWPGYGRTNGQQHFSPLSEINLENVGELGLAWSMDLPQESSVTEPLEIGDVLYFASGLSKVHAVDARTGKLLWRYDPEVGKVGGLNMRTGWGVRGIAWWNGKIYVGTQQGRLIALDAKTGEPVWSVETIRPEDPAQVNGAPRAFNGVVMIGFAGTTGAMRGYVTAYDAETGKQLWRFYTVPGQPGVDTDETTKIAADSWSGEWWKFGGGAAAWHSMAFDPETDTVFIGTGSPYPWSHRRRSEGKGDNLFVASIVALDRKTGKYKWHYQTVPGDTWDFDAIMDIQFADIEIDGKPRKVLMQAPKNGFYYVIDRITGEFISAEPIVEVNWASHIDPETGRPVEIEGARFEDGPARITPTSSGAHNWMAMSYDPKAGIVYIPVIHFEADYSEVDEWEPSEVRTHEAGISIIGGAAFGLPPATGSLLAWSPKEQKKLWEVPYPTHLNGGVLATGGNLVFQGSVDGFLRAYDAKTGKEVWSFDTGAPILAAPISYKAGGKQYVTLLTGISMGFAMYAPAMLGPGIEKYRIDPMTQPRRVLTFSIGGTGTLAPPGQPAAPPLDRGFKSDPERVQAGFMAYEAHCLSCHGDSAVGIGNGPDLRRSAVVLDKAIFDDIVRGGSLESRGMAKFPELSDTTLWNIRHYIRKRMKDLREQGPGADMTPPGYSIAY
jgi:quinohemoprotein ethanol dehydrogenase